MYSATSELLADFRESSSESKKKEQKTIYRVSQKKRTKTIYRVSQKKVDTFEYSAK